MTFEQVNTITERGVGKTNIIVRFADSYSNLYATTGVETIDLITLDKMSEEAGTMGGLIEGEIKFDVNTLTAKGSNFLTFMQTDSVRVVGIFYNDVTTSNAKMFGLVEESYEIEDFKWESSTWATDISEYSVITYTVKSFAAAVLDTIKLSDIIADLKADSAFTANVIDGQAYNTNVYAKNLISLNKVIQGMSNKLASRLSSYGITSITFESKTLPFVAHPTRWREKTIDGINYGTLEMSCSTDCPPYEVGDHPYDVDKNVFNAVVLDPGETTATTANTLFINAALLFEYNEQDATKANGDKWGKKYESFLDLLTALTYTLGLHFKLSLPSTSTIHISLMGAEDFTTDEILIPDVTKSRQTIALTEEDEKGEMVNAARSFYFAKEGYGEYDLQASGKTEVSIEPESLPLTLSPTLAITEVLQTNPDPYARFEKYLGAIPHNHENNIVGIYNISSESVHTGLYIYNNYYTPVAGISTIVDGENKYYDSIIKYIQARGLMAAKYDLERELTIPYITNFKISGGSINHQVLQVGKIITINGHTYTIQKIETDFVNITTDLKLKSTSNYALSQPITGSEGVRAATGTVINTGSNQSGEMQYYIAGETLEVGQVVARYYDAGVWKVEKALSVADNYGRVIGIATNYAGLGDKVTVKTSGIATVPLTLIVGEKVYLRGYVGGSGSNLSQTGLEAKTINEDYYLEVGTAYTSNEVEINIINGGIYL